MNKKILALFPFVGSMLLVGCGNNAPAQTSREEKGIIKEATTITFWSNSSYGDIIDSLAAQFKEIEPNVTFENVKQTGSYNDVKDMVVQGIPANNYPDMFIGYPDSVQEIMQYGKVLRLDSYMDNAEYGWTAAEKADIIESYLLEGQSYPAEGTYSLPFAKSTEAMFYNADVLLNLNLSTIDSTINGGRPLTHDYLNNLTWEELFEHLAPALTVYDDGLPADQKIINKSLDYHGIFAYDSDDNLFITLAEQYGYGYTSLDKTTGTGHIDFVNPGMKGLMKTFAAAHAKDYLYTKASAGNNYTNNFYTKGAMLFTVGSTGGLKYQIPDNGVTNMARIPHAAGKAPKVINQGPSIAIFDHADANRALASWLFYKFISNTANNTNFALNSGYNAIRTSVYATDEYLEYIKTEGKTGLELLQAKSASYVESVSDQLYLSPVFKGSSEARTQAASIVSQCLAEASLTDERIDDIFQTAYENVLKKM